MGRAVRPRVAVVTARAATGRDEDEPLLRAALAACGLDAAVAAWDDPDVPWVEHDAAVLRSTWDDAGRHAELLAWAGRVAATTRLRNPLAAVAWNTDRHSLRDLAEAGVATVPTPFVEPGDAPPALPCGAADAEPVTGLHAEEVITARAPTGAERSMAERALAVAVRQGGAPLSARVGLLPGEDGAPVLLELTEPSLFPAHCPGAADRLAAALVPRLR